MGQLFHATDGIRGCNMSSDRVPLPLVQLRAANQDNSSRQATAKIQLTIADQPVNVEVTVPTEPTQITNLLPIFQGMANLVVGIGEQKVADRGEHISCSKGCGACCRQLVPISEMEARSLAALVKAMPEPRRNEVEQRFAYAQRQVVDAGLEAQLQAKAAIPKEQLQTLGLAYFDLGIPCPFLEEESCSIHPDRPLGCREYLVTSPASACAKPTKDTIRMVPIPASVAQAARSLERQVYGDQVQWMPLTTALTWTKEHPEAPTPQPGTTLLQGFFQNLAG